jgi:hypothetical protein
MESRENFLLAIRSIFPGGGILSMLNMLKLLGFSPDLTFASASDSFMIHKALMVLWNIWVSVVQLAGVMFPKPWAL